MEVLNGKEKNLKLALAKKSVNPEGKTLHELCGQWENHKYRYGGKAECVCGTQIVHNHIIRNKHNKKLLVVGNKCIERFGRRMGKISDQLAKIHKRKRTTKSKINRCKICGYKRFNCKCKTFEYLPCPHCDIVRPAGKLQNHINKKHANIIFADVEMPHGKHKGRTLGELVCKKFERNYLKWILKNHKLPPHLELAIESLLWWAENAYPILRAKQLKKRERATRRKKKK